MIRLRHKLLIHVFRLLDQLMLAATGLGIIYFRPEIRLQGVSPILQATFQIEDTVGMLILAIGWIGIFDYFIRYKADRLVALNTQIRNLVKATGLASFWLMTICAIFSIKSFNIFNILIFFAVVTSIGDRKSVV